MNNLKELSLKDYDFDIPLTNKTLFWDTFENVSGPKYRTTPVTKTIDIVKTTDYPIENISGVKELKNASNLSKTFYEATDSTPNSNVLFETSKHSSNISAKNSTNALQPEEDSEHPFLDRMEQGSLSEPTLATAKDRGDSIEFQDICTRETTTLQNIDEQTLGSDKKLLPKKQVVRGYIFIKNAGNIYKSAIEAVKLQADDNFRNDLSRFTQPFRSSTSKNIHDENIFEKNGFKFETDEMGDFEIAIYLSGSMTAGRKLQKQNTMDFGRVQRGECEGQSEKIRKKKKAYAGKGGDPFGKSCEIVNKAHTSSSKLTRAKQRKAGRRSRVETRSSYRINKQNAELDFPGDDSSVEYELDESGTIISKRKVKDNRDNSLDSSSSNVRNLVKPSDSGDLSCRSRKTGTMSSRSKFVSQSSLSGYSNGYGIPKLKVTDEELWETFEMIFRNYASTNRHSGEVIPRKISSEWMMNTGVVSDFLSQKEADDAFRSIAGTKITMNAQEYKDFLISLTLKKKLPYYVIYRRMCGM